jgi:hypothetical protein
LGIADPRHNTILRVFIPVGMALRHGTLHIVRNFYTTENQGVYDVIFSRADQSEPDPKPVLRRFPSDNELSEFLKRDLRRDPKEVATVMRALSDQNRAAIPSLQLDENELRRLKLAA